MWLVIISWLCSDSGESSWEEVSEEEEEEEEKKEEEGVDGSASIAAAMAPSQLAAANPTPAPALSEPAIAKEMEEEVMAEGSGSPVVPSKPKYATHEEAKAAFKELLRDKVQ